MNHPYSILSPYLHIQNAVEACDIAALDALVATHGRDVIAACCRAHCMLRLAASLGLIAVLQWLADLGVATEGDCVRPYNNPLTYAATEGQVEALDWFAQNFVALGLTPAQILDRFAASACLRRAAENGHVSVLRRFAALGIVTRAACLATGWDSRAALHTVKHGCIPVLEWFAQHYAAMGIPPEEFVRDCLSDNGSLITEAAANNLVDVLDWLAKLCFATGFSAEAFATILNTGDHFALFLALQENHFAVADWFAAHGAAGPDACWTALDNYGFYRINAEGLRWFARACFREGRTPDPNDFVNIGREDVWQECMEEYQRAKFGVLVVAARRFARTLRALPRLPAELCGWIVSEFLDGR
jgi:hypothetical protein